ncbi:MAG: hypothetical protein IKX14_05330 [Neisseriaceae bacterium]|nr:hypothetical protein [Neisseriaceae bacterium]
MGLRPTEACGLVVGWAFLPTRNEQNNFRQPERKIEALSKKTIRFA